MLDQTTKRKIDSARDILVGKVPDPKAQVEQITTALVYKFMDDMDKEAEELGGKAKFLTGDLKEFAWNKLLDKRFSGQERMDVYVRAISLFSTAKQLPQLFRDIFKDTFLPYRDQETLSLFLKEIDNFSYDHSEDLGNAFEYLLSVLGSQGDAGQFRTPRHIIDFIVGVVGPKKNETILDPACGTAGFLISAYKHILRDHDALDNKTGKPTNEEKHLTPDERKKLMNNFVGYDISPDMVKLSLVNMYLHGFQEPKIYEYDTLTSEKHWGEQFDVIMANPPFMSPKGGIRPHKRFSVQAKRSEVLFVDYILEHLSIKGRAGIIVPEGIIFKSENAYKKLRQMLLEDGLFAVASLPQGVFNPYAGVKTSILFFDNQLAKNVQHILFVKIYSDGFSLGAQRQPVSTNDIPVALEAIKGYREYVLDGGHMEKSGWPGIPEVDTNPLCQFVLKQEIAESGDYNLTSDRYIEVETRQGQKWPLIELNDLIKTITPPEKIHKSNFGKTGKYPIIDQSQKEIAGWTNDEGALVNFEKPVVVFGDHTLAVKYYERPFAQGADGIKILETSNKLLPKFLFFLLKNQPIKSDGYKRHFSKLKRHKIPLPPLEVQKEIVEQIEVKQNAITHAKEIIKNLERERRYFGQELGKLEGVEWMELASIANLVGGGTPPKTNAGYWKNGTIKWISAKHISEENKVVGYDLITKEAVKDSATSVIPKGSIIFVTRVSVGKLALADDDYAVNQDLTGIILRNKDMDSRFLFHFLRTQTNNIASKAQGLGVKGITRKEFGNYKIPLPPPEIQKQLVAEAEKEEEIITANRRLIDLMEAKIDKCINNL